MAAIAFTVSSGSVAFADGGTLDYDTADTYCSACKVGGRVLDIRPVAAPGELGHGMQNFGGGMLAIELDCIYVDISEANNIASFAVDADTLAEDVFTLTINGSGVYSGCILTEAKSDQPRRTGLAGGLYRMNATFKINCLRP